ncbi:hypothetical protein [Litchfieldia salsa]|uniref:Uncharacterized protein n=1 Tax=Litchfieldia salsa TaxID=930152 RepID=A0A1H0WTG1_9BACI|nr:hypothetical protein [Litchfieldia salsa]SDP93991.1 hypothetical protein SAMN05216565_11577 [Litchfieldia salsa]
MYFNQDLEKVAKRKREEFELEAQNFYLSKALRYENRLIKSIRMFIQKSTKNQQIKTQCCTN